MAYIVLTIVGLLALILVKKNWPQRKQFFFVGIIIVAGALFYVLLDAFILESNGEITKGEENIFSKIPWLDFGLYFVMLLGMASKYLYDAIGEKKRRKIRFNIWQFLKPFLVSPIIFGTILTQIPENMPVFTLLILSYQNGFFWHTLLYKAGPEKEPEDSTGKK